MCTRSPQTSGWWSSRRLASALPVAMAISGGRLYVANGVSEYGNLPRGSVEAYAIDRDRPAGLDEPRRPFRSPVLHRATWRLLRMDAAWWSRCMAVAHTTCCHSMRTGDWESVGDSEGDWLGPHPLQAAAHPAAVMFDREGRVLTADQGSDKLNVLALSEGGLAVSSRCEVSAGSGPGCMVMHPDGRRCMWRTH